MPLLSIPAFNDNYIWLLHRAGQALVVDPGEAAGVLQVLQQQGLQLQTIFVTHHHGDHTGAVAALRQATGAHVIGPANEPMPEPLQRVRDGDTVSALGWAFEVLHVPGHTAGHLAYYSAEIEGTPVLFCGDTLFSAGCGRLFEGTAAQMLQSLDRLAALPASTQVCCAHEYTLSNLKFAQAVEPLNADVLDHTALCLERRAQGLPTLPTTLGLERRINPFLRSRATSVRQMLTQQGRLPPDAACDDAQVFAALRTWKNVF